MTDLEIPDFSMVGPTGERDNLKRLSDVLVALVAPGTVLDIEVRHDEECPSAEGLHVESNCTCERVDITVRSIRKGSVN